MFKVNIEVYSFPSKDPLIQAKYLAHGYEDVLWTNNLESAIIFIKDSIEVNDTYGVHLIEE